MKLKKLVQGLSIEIKGSKEVAINGLSFDSRKVAPGNLFIAKKGSSLDGNEFILQALENGASAILTQFYNPFVKVPQLISKSPEAAASQLAARFYKEPSKKLFLTAVTGTNGKTTTSYLIQELLQRLKKPCGLVGTVETILGNKRSFSTLTTHDVITNQKLFSEMVQEKCEAAVLEVSSHGLDQGRVEEIEFDTAIFTNLTPDHLDYHPSMEAYAMAKKRLFELLDKSQKKHKRAIFNADDPWHAKLLEKIESPAFLFSIDHDQADLRAKEIELTSFGSQFTIHYRGEKERFKTPLIGRFNIYNILGALSVGIHLGWSLKEMALIIPKLKGAPGRLERVENSSGKHVFIDYAHTGDALFNVLTVLRETSQSRIITVFGAGGNRDPGRREGLAKAAEAFSDLCILTTDNPRQEDPKEIIRQILAAFKNPRAAQVEMDRKTAIEKAIEQANAGDIVLIAGKGHEKVQIFGHQTLSFDDREVALSYLKGKS